MPKSTNKTSSQRGVARNPRDFPDLIAAMRLDFEVNGMGWKRLHKKYTVPASTIRVFAREQGWKRPTPEKDLETAILATGLRQTTIAGREHDEMPPNPSMAPVTAEQASPEPPPEPLGEDEPPDTLNSSTEPPESPIHQSGIDLPRPAEPVPPAPELVSEPVQKEDATPVTEAPAAAPEPEPEPKPKVGKTAPKLVEKIHEVQPDEPLSEGANWLKGKKPDPPKSADIINFPRAPVEPPRGATVVHFLPEQLGEEKTRLRVTLTAIKSMMTLEQVQQLEHHEALLRRYSHLIEVYLEPMRFVDVEGLDDDMKAEKIVATQRLAMQMLLPTERDTLAGAFKVLTEAIRSSIVLKRAVVGLHPVKGGATMPSRDPMFRDDPEAEAEVKGLLDLSTLDTGQLRHVQQAMEMLQRHQHRQNAAPTPPDPDPIEDLRNPDYVPPETDPEIPR
jgi:hypothetical protein